LSHDRPNIQTNGLDLFLEGERVRRYTPAESLERLKDAFRPPFPDEQDYPSLVIALWRWTRVVAQTFGRVTDDETLESALEDATPDPWVQELKPIPSPIQRALLRLDSTEILFKAAHMEGLPLLPPGYDENRLALWCEAFESVAHDIRLVKAPNGPRTLLFLTNPRSAAQVGITAENILSFEELIIDEAQAAMVRHGERSTMNHFREKYGFSRREALSLVRLARADALIYGKSSIEEDRALMVAQLKDYLSRSQDSMNMADEMRALKELARVQGLTRSEPEDRAQEFLGVIKRVAGRQDAAMLSPHVAEQFDVDEEDLDLGSLPPDLQEQAIFDKEDRWHSD